MARYVVTVDGREYDVVLEYHSENYRATVNGRPTEITYNHLGENRFLLLADREALEVDVRPAGGNGDRIVFMLGQEIPVTVEDYHVAQARKAAGIVAHVSVERQLRAPMPGLVLKIHVTPGQRVVKGQPLVVIEAMKMENIIKAKSDSTVAAVTVTVGRTVEKGDPLIEFQIDGH
jgi:biotin carboxyl carrier protein